MKLVYANCHFLAKNGINFLFNSILNYCYNIMYYNKLYYNKLYETLLCIIKYCRALNRGSLVYNFHNFHNFGI